MQRFAFLVPAFRTLRSGTTGPRTFARPVLAVPTAAEIATGNDAGPLIALAVGRPAPWASPIIANRRVPSGIGGLRSTVWRRPTRLWARPTRL